MQLKQLRFLNLKKKFQNYSHTVQIKTKVMIGKLLPFLSKIKSQFIDCFVSLCQLTSQKNIQKAEEFKLDAHLFKYNGCRLCGYNRLFWCVN